MEMGEESNQTYNWRYEFQWQILMKYVRLFFAKGMQRASAWYWFRVVAIFIKQRDWEHEHKRSKNTK